MPPFWERWPFVVLVALCATGLLLWWYRGRSRRYRRRQRRLNTIIAERTHELKAKNLALKLANLEREDLVRKLAYQAGHDALTGLPNRRTRRSLPQRGAGAGAEHAARPCAWRCWTSTISRRSTMPTATRSAMRCCAGSARRCAPAFGEQAFAARHGGEEFLLVLRSAPRENLTMAAERLCRAVAAHPFVFDHGRQGRVTCSIGLAEFPFVHDPDNLLGWEQLLVLADRALYQAKAKGRNGWAAYRPVLGAQAEQVLAALQEPLRQMQRHACLTLVHNGGSLPPA